MELLSLRKRRARTEMAISSTVHRVAIVRCSNNETKYVRQIARAHDSASPDVDPETFSHVEWRLRKSTVAPGGR